jgi:trimethylamine---corrinoid protein Co-methyltransferase
VAQHYALARALPHVNLRFMTGCPWAPSAEESPLYERFFCWKYGVVPSGILHPLAMAPRLKALYEAYAALKGKRLREVFTGSVFMVSPLRLTREEAAQFVWWWEQGCRVGVEHMTTAGLSAPVTPAGMIVVNLAEQIALALLHKACYGESRLRIYTMVSAVDMRTMIRPYGRPEMPIGDLLGAAMARFYGVEAMGHSGLTDAKQPSCEAGAQKAISALACLLGGADAMVEAGLLSLDEVHSPIQMILDHELAGALLRFLKPADTSEEAIGFETIREVGPGGTFSDQMHTAEHFRDAIWEPSVWTRQMLAAWEQGGRRNDVDRARERYHAIMDGARPVIELSEEEQAELLALIRGGGAA